MYVKFLDMCVLHLIFWYLAAPLLSGSFYGRVGRVLQRKLLKEWGMTKEYRFS